VKSGVGKEEGGGESRLTSQIAEDREWEGFAGRLTAVRIKGRRKKSFLSISRIAKKGSLRSYSFSSKGKKGDYSLRKSGRFMQCGRGKGRDEDLINTNFERSEGKRGGALPIEASRV